MARATYLTYAFLRLRLDQGVANPLALLDPIIKSVFTKNPNRKFNLVRIQLDVERAWGIFIPLNVLDYILGKLVKAGFLLKTDREQSWSIKKQELSQNFEHVRSNAANTYARVVRTINIMLSKVEKNAVTADEVLQRYLETGSLALLNYDTSPASPSEKDIFAQRVIAAAIEGPDGRNEQFIEDLTSLAMGNAIYQAIIGISEAENIEEAEVQSGKIKDLSLYIDSRILSASLGYSSKEEIQAADELFEMAKKTKCSLRCWTHTVGEIENVMIKVAIALSRGSIIHGPIRDYIMDNNILPSELLDKADNLKEDVTKKGVVIDDIPIDNHLPNERIKILEELLEKEVGYRTKEALLRDRDSLVATYNARSGKGYEYFEECGVIFITSNKGVSYTAERYFRKHFRETGRRNKVSLCMTDAMLACRLWIKLPTIINIIPKLQIVRQTLDNIYPTKDEIKRFASHLQDVVATGRLRGETAVRLMLASRTARLLALDEFFHAEKEGDNPLEAILIKTIEEDKKRLREAEESEKKKEQEVNRYLEELLSKREHELFEQWKSREDANAAEIDKLARELASERAKKNEMVISYMGSKWLTGKLSQIFIRGISLISVIMLIYMGGRGFLPQVFERMGFGSTGENALDIIAFLVSIVLGIMTIAGFSVAGLFRQPEIWLRRKLEFALRRAAEKGREHQLERKEE